MNILLKILKELCLKLTEQSAVDSFHLLNQWSYNIVPYPPTMHIQTGPVIVTSSLYNDANAHPNRFTVWL